MKRLIVFAAVVICGLAGCTSVGRHQTVAPSNDDRSTRATTRDGKFMAESEAIARARAAVGDAVNLGMSGPPVVRLHEGRYTVTFPTKLKPRERGPDYLAEIVLDASTGEVLLALVGS